MDEKQQIVDWLRRDSTWKDVVNLTWAMSNDDIRRACIKLADMLENDCHTKGPQT